MLLSFPLLRIQAIRIPAQYKKRQGIPYFHIEINAGNSSCPAHVSSVVVFRLVLSTFVRTQTQSTTWSLLYLKEHPADALTVRSGYKPCPVHGLVLLSSRLVYSVADEQTLDNQQQGTHYEIHWIPRFLQ